MHPTGGDLIYPTLAVRSRFPEAGLYQACREVRNKAGIPVEIGMRWLFVSVSIPIVTMSLLTSIEIGGNFLSQEDMTILDALASHYVNVYAQSDAG